MVDKLLPHKGERPEVLTGVLGLIAELPVLAPAPRAPALNGDWLPS